MCVTVVIMFSFLVYMEAVMSKWTDFLQRTLLKITCLVYFMLCEHLHSVCALFCFVHLTGMNLSRSFNSSKSAIGRFVHCPKTTGANSQFPLLPPHSAFHLPPYQVEPHYQQFWSIFKLGICAQKVSGFCSVNPNFCSHKIPMLAVTCLLE